MLVLGGFKSQFCTGDVGEEASVRAQDVSVVMVQGDREVDECEQISMNQLVMRKLLLLSLN